MRMVGQRSALLWLSRWSVGASPDVPELLIPKLSVRI